VHSSNIYFLLNVYIMFSTINSFSSVTSNTYLHTLATNLIANLPYIWLKYDANDLTNTTTLKNYGTQGIDATIVSNNGVLPTIVTGQTVGTGCISLLGSNGNYVSIGTVTIPPLGYTYSTWFKFPVNGTIGNGDRLLDFANVQADNINIAFLSSTVINVFSSVSNASVTSTVAKAFNDGNWHHFAFTHNKSTGIWNTYIDGVNIIVNQNYGGYPTAATTKNNYLGLSAYTGSYPTVFYDDFKMYNTDLSSTIITQIYNKTY
jgi:hypothetical protein